MALDQSMDTYNYNRINNPKAKAKLIDIMSKNNLIDIYRNPNLNTKAYTWRSRNPIKHVRIDYFIRTNTLNDIIHATNIIPGYRSDH